MKFLKIFFVSSFVFLLSAQSLFAASLSFSPSSGSYNKNATFSVGVFVSSPDQAMNAVSGTVTFPTDKIQVVSVSKNNSIINFWAQEPSFSNTAGTIKFEGVALTPGYQGAGGRILTINFKGRTAGIAGIKMTQGVVLANDGVGTSILSSSGEASFTIKEVESVAPVEVIDLDELPTVENIPPIESCSEGALIYSTTHPGQMWRKENTAIFSWDLKDDVVASRIAFDRNPTTDPTVLSKPAIVEKKYENLEDGVWYFHLSLQDNQGWSKPEHFRIEIDATPPELKLSEIKRTDLTNPKPVISLQMSDKSSCIKNFDIKIDGEKVDYNKLSNGNYELETIDPGDHELSVVVYDRAGNQNEAFIDVKINPLETPKVNEYQERVSNSSEISVKGETLQNANLTAKITSKNANFLAKEDFQSGSGRWTWTPGTKLKNGTYFVSFKVSDTRGASSNWSEPIQIKVGNGISLNLNISSLINKIPPKFAMVGMIVLGVLLVIVLTRALTIKSVKRHHEDYWK